MDSDILIGVIGGSGLYGLKGLEILEEREMDTPFGPPSDAIVIGRYEGRKIAFIPRHGRGHHLNPSKVPYRANIWALKQLGVFWCISVSAVGSLKEEIVPEHFVIPDQIIDRTRKRPETLFDEIAVHVGFRNPFDPQLRGILLKSCREEGVTVHDGGTYVCMEGPLFSTFAESQLHRSWGASLIGMTAVPEAKFAREAEMAYATIALATDYDVWRAEGHVEVNEVLAHIRNNVSNVHRVLGNVFASIPLGKEESNEAYSALKGAIMTSPKLIPESTWDAWGTLIQKYIKRPT